MTTTPNTVSELLELNQKEQNPHQELFDLLDELTPSETINLTSSLINKLTKFHWSTVEDIDNGECEEPLKPWFHDSVVLSQVQELFHNMTDFHQQD